MPRAPRSEKALYEAFARFLHEPSGAKYLAAGEQLVEHPAYDPYSAEPQLIYALVSGGRHAAALELARKAMPNCLLSPGVHLMASVAHEALGDRDEAADQGEIARLCCQGILGTGDGSAEAPYQVLRVSDEYAVLEMTGRVHVRHVARSRSGRLFDVFGLSEGAEVWFDITGAFEHARRAAARSPGR